MKIDQITQADIESYNVFIRRLKPSDGDGYEAIFPQLERTLVGYGESQIEALDDLMSSVGLLLDSFKEHPAYPRIKYDLEVPLDCALEAFDDRRMRLEEIMRIVTQSAFYGNAESIDTAKLVNTTLTARLSAKCRCGPCASCDFLLLGDWVDRIELICNHSTYAGCPATNYMIGRCSIWSALLDCQALRDYAGVGLLCLVEPTDERLREDVIQWLASESQLRQLARISCWLNDPHPDQLVQDALHYRDFSVANWLYQSGHMSLDDILAIQKSNGGDESA